MELVRVSDATHTAAQSGPWSDASTWQSGTVPNASARVHIPQNITVTLGRVITTPMETIRIDGTLSFSATANTELRVDTMVSTSSGHLEIGTSEQPIADTVTAAVIFADDGAINKSCDTQQIGRGAVLMGRTTMFGAAKTHRAALATFPRTGDTTITLKQAPSNWQVGDELIITGTIAGDPRSDEIRTIQSINGATVTLNSALERDHVAPVADLNVYVANATRNIQFQSENTAVLNRGHIMFMHTLDVDVQNVRFSNLGRTDKRRELDDLFFDFDIDQVGNAASAPTVFRVEDLGGSNIRGRYPIHFHRGGTTPGGTPGIVQGSVVFEGPGWGFVSHSANVNFINNVSYGLQGAGFYTEAGDEIGLMQGNIAIRSVNDNFRLDDGGAIDPDLGAANQEFGNDGDGYWLSGTRVSMIDNVAAGTTAHGFIYWTDGLVEADIPTPARMSVKVSEIENGNLMPGRERIPVWWAPMAEFRGNEAYVSTIGFRARYMYAQSYLGEGGSAFHAKPPQAYIDTLFPTLTDTTLWNHRDGMLLNYNARMNIRNARIIGIGAPFVLNGGTANHGVGLDIGTEITNGHGRIENVTIEGFEMGFVAPLNDQWVVDGLTSKNTRDIYIGQPRQSPRSLNMSNVVFGDTAGTAVAGSSTQRLNVTMTAEFDDPSFQPFFFLLPDHITLNGQGLYFDQQAASFVPLSAPFEDPIAVVTDDYFNRTNQQLQSQFGLSFGGQLLPSGVTSPSSIRGGAIGPLPQVSTNFPQLFDMTNGGDNPEPAQGTTQPQITGNYLQLTPNATVILTRANLNSLDTNTGPAELTYTFSNVQGGFFNNRSAPLTAITQFTQAEVDAGVVRFTHTGGQSLPSYVAVLSDGSSNSASSLVTVQFLE